MSTTTSSFILSPDICSSTDKDGTTILDIGRDKIYSVIGVGSLVWKEVASSPSGVTLDSILEAVCAEFKDVPRGQIERDVDHLLASLRERRLVQVGKPASCRKVQMIRTAATSILMFFSRGMIGLLLRIGLNSLAALFGFALFNLVLRALGFRAFYIAVKAWPLRGNRADCETQKLICDAVDVATTWYPKQAMCLQRSAITACFLRERGIAAEMVIGCRKIPYKAHAWVEVDGEVTNDKNQVQVFYKVLGRL